MFAFRLNTTPSPGAGLPVRERRIAFIAVLLNVGMANLDTAIANTALPTIARDLAVGEAQSIWVVSIYQIAMVAALLPLASLGEIIGHRRISMAGLVLFTLASLVCGLAPSFEWLLAGRIVQGVSAAGILGVGLAMTRFIYPQHAVGRGMGFNALVVGLSFAAGPTIASLVLSVASWHWLFLMNVPLGLVGMVLGRHSLPPTPRGAWKFDGWAAFLCAVMLGVAAYVLNAAAQGTPWGMTLAGSALVLLTLIFLLRRQNGNPAPMLAIDLLRRPAFALSAVTAFLSFVAQSLAFISLPFLFQTVFGYSQVDTGFLITPWPLFVAAAAPLAGRLSDRIPVGILGCIGLATLAVGMALLAALPPQPGAFDICWRMAVCGCGFGFFQSPNMRAFVMEAPPERSGGAAGMSSVVRNFGQSSGAALLAALFNLLGAQGGVTALWGGAVFAFLASLVSLLRVRPAAQEATETPF